MEDGYANVDIVVRLLHTGSMNLESEKRYRVIIVYKFVEQKITFENIPLNPTGFLVLDYTITQIAVIKELDTNKKVSKDFNSKIKENKQSNDLSNYIQNDVDNNPSNPKATYPNIDDYIRNNPNIFPKNNQNTNKEINPFK
ncbi:MAG: hypothetical protein K2P17_01460 [Helicobacteraceae bacterium]|nr:hypothetical protein [Helicobacteraceae bacterium]